MSYDIDTRPLYRTEDPTATPSTASTPSPRKVPTPGTPATPRSPQTPELTAVEPPEPEPQPKKLELSLTQLVGGALAAMTAAALGSRIGVGGTVIGAAVASVIAGVGGALYTASLRRTRDTVRTVFRGRPVTPAAQEPTSRYAGVTFAVSPATPPMIATSNEPSRKPRLWPRILIGAVATFALAGGVLTGFELITGHALSGGSGTTIERVGTGSQEPGSQQSSRTDDDSAVRTEPSVAPSSSAEPSTTDEPSVAPSDRPSSTPSAAQSSAVPTTSPSAPPSTPAPSSQPSESSAGGVSATS